MEVTTSAEALRRQGPLGSTGPRRLPPLVGPRVAHVVRLAQADAPSAPAGAVAPSAPPLVSLSPRVAPSVPTERSPFLTGAIRPRDDALDRVAAPLAHPASTPACAEPES